METKIVKVADICIDGKIVDINGKVRAEAFVYENHYSETQTKDIINRIMKKEIPITRKLDRKGYIFNDDLEIVSVEAEVIQYLLEYCLNRKIEFGQEFGQQARAIYYDKDYIRQDGRKIGNMVEELYNEHFGIK